MAAGGAARAAEPKIYVSEIVTFAAEARAFVLDRSVADIALYEGDAPLDGAAALASVAARHAALPPTCVLDVGFIPGRGWAVVEANAAWGAGLNGCDPHKVVACIARATGVGA